MRDEVFNDCLETQKEMRGTNKPFWPDLAEKWGYDNGEQMRGVFKRERKKRGKMNFSVAPDTVDSGTTYQEKDNFINIVYANTPLKTKEDVIREYNIDMDKWKIDFFEIKPSQAYRKDKQVDWQVENSVVVKGMSKDSGKMLVVQLYNLRIKFVPKKVDDITLEDVKRVLLDKKFEFPVINKSEYSPSNEILEIDVMDLHFGSDANHNPENRFSLAIDDVITRIGTRKFEKILFCMLGDIFHYDNVSKTTSAGTIMTTNGMTAFQEFDLAVSVFVENIRKLMSFSPVEIVFVPGNHDTSSGYHLLKVLEAVFENNENIVVDAGHQARKVRLLGKNLVGWMHGDMPKSRASIWLQVEAASEWGKSEYREIHSGNFHSQDVVEDGGVILRYLPGMTDIDEWHYNKGYVGAVRAMISFVWDKDRGLREQWFTVTS